jgi:hypothetical protein
MFPAVKFIKQFHVMSIISLYTPLSCAFIPPPPCVSGPLQRLYVGELLLGIFLGRENMRVIFAKNLRMTDVQS